MIRALGCAALAFVLTAGWPAGRGAAQTGGSGASAGGTDVGGGTGAGGAAGGADADVPLGDVGPEAAEPAPSEAPGAEEDTAAAEETGEAQAPGGGPTDAELLRADPDALIDPLPRRPRTGVFGRVIDAGTGEPVYAEVPIDVVENGERQFTTTDGFFAIQLRPGTYTLRAFFEGFVAARVPDVEVAAGQVTELVIRLAADTEGAGGPVITITAESGTVARRLEQRREATQVSDGFTAEEIRQSGDSDAGQAARRIVGLTLDRDGFPTVRGLSGRYVTTLVNGSPFPSTDPDNPSIRLTLFPTSVLAGISVLKTFTPDLPGAMTGGTIDIETRTYPARFTVAAGVSVAANTETTFANVLTYDGGDLDWLCFDDGSRDLPDGLMDERLPDGDVDLARTFNLDYVLRDRTALPGFGLGVALGDTLLVGERYLGYYVSLGYGYNEQQFTNIVTARTTVDEDGSNRATTTFSRDESIVEVDLNALGTVTLEVAENQTLQYTTVFTRVAEDFAAQSFGLDPSENQVFRQQRFAFTTEQVWWNQLQGEHRDLVGEIDLDWRLSIATADREEPDIRDLAYRQGDPGEPFRFFGQNPEEGQRLFTNLDQLELGAAADLSFPLLEGTFKAGFFATGFDRSYGLRRFQLRGDPQNPFNSLPPEELFVPELLGPGGGFDLVEQTRAVDSYDATQRNYAAYAQLDTDVFVDWLRLVAGVRGEVFRQTVETNPEFAPENTVTTNERTDVDPLPSVNLVARIYEAAATSAVPGTMQVRAGYTQTVARPLIRELAPFTFPDYRRGGTVQGNPDLVRSRIQNVDLRWEWFLSATEVVAVSGFVKLFEDPIERVATGANNQFGFANIAEARNLGVEIEGRFDLGRFTAPLSGLTVGANLTLVDSSVEIDPAERGTLTNIERPIQGQSPYVVNASLTWSPPPSRKIPLTLALFYNVFGEAISEVGLVGLQDIYRQPFHELNFTAQWDIDERLGLRLTLRNLLLSEQDFLQDDILVYSDAPGMTAKLDFTFNFEEGLAATGGSDDAEAGVTTE